MLTLPMSESAIFQVELVEEFFRAVAFNAGLTLHITVEYGKNNHHMIEAIFKGFGRALRDATRIDPSIEGVLSTKGQL
jgi:imidazoleglycerol-phosphate dehydratase